MNVRVLVVEDEELSAQAHTDYVRRTAGFEVAGVVPEGEDGRAPVPPEDRDSAR